eukprot:1273871-Rhodomonas_salina.2
MSVRGIAGAGIIRAGNLEQIKTKKTPFRDNLLQEMGFRAFDYALQLTCVSSTILFCSSTLCLVATHPLRQYRTSPIECVSNP